MKRILKIGMDVHTTNYTLCAMEPVIGEEDRVFATMPKESITFRAMKKEQFRSIWAALNVILSDCTRTRTVSRYSYGTTILFLWPQST